MLINIVWKTNSYKNSREHILGLFLNKKEAIDTRDQHNKNNDKYSEVDNQILNSRELMEDFSMIYNKDLSYVTELEIGDECKTLFFTKIQESGGGGSYHEIAFMYVEESFEDAIENAYNYFDNEHNRDEECKKCLNDHCRSKLLKKLTDTGCAGINCTDFDGACVEIWSIDV